MLVHVVEDDAVARQWFTDILRSAGHQVKGHADAQEFLDKLDRGIPSCLVLDMLLPGMSGMGLLQHIQNNHLEIPTICVSSYGDVPTAVAAMKAGALDFLEKPVSAQTLLNVVEQASTQHTGRRKSRDTSEEIQGLMARLTPREREVMGMIIAGLSNKEMARQMGLSPKTVEAHRAKLYTKMRADSLADLVRKGIEGNISEYSL